MAVDLKRGETLPIHINMSFPSLPCDGQYLPFLCSLSAIYIFLFLWILSYYPLLYDSFLSHILLMICSFVAVLSVDAIDLSGKHEVDLDTSIWKVSYNFSTNSDNYGTCCFRGTEIWQYYQDLGHSQHSWSINRSIRISFVNF